MSKTLKETYGVYAVCTLLVAFSLNWATATLAGIDEPIYTPDFFAFGTALALTLLAQIIVILLIHNIIHQSYITCSAATIFIVANAWSMHFILIEAYGSLSSIAQAIILLGLSGFTFTLLLIARNSKWYRLTLLGVLAIILVNVANYITRGPLIERDPDIVVGTSMAHHALLTPSSKIKRVNFNQTPNIYVIGFESAAPAATLKRYLQLEQPPLFRGLIERDFRIFPNVFSEGNATRASWHAMLSMEADYAVTISKTLGKGQLFSGSKASPFFDIFRHNGYKITSLYKNSYLGPSKGPYVDRYIIAAPFSPCDKGFLSKEVLSYLFWGACRLRFSWFKRSAMYSDPIKQLEQTLIEAGRSAIPELVIAHTDKPVHTPTGGSWKGSEADLVAFRRQYNETSLVAVSRLDRILNAIKRSSKPAIALIVGDHGPILSRGLPLEQNDIFIVQDQFGVLAGIFPRDACQTTFDKAQRIGGYFTTPQLLRLIIQCLANGEDPFIVPYTHSIVIKGRRVSFGDYRYE